MLARPKLVMLLIALGLWVVWSGLATAAPGDLDPTFGVGGKFLVNLGGNDDARAVTLQPDGKILIAGSTNNEAGVIDQVLARLVVPQGALDPSYGGGAGWSRLDFGGTDVATSLALQPDGKILVGGSTTAPSGAEDGTVARLLNPQGTLDLSYGGGFGWSRIDLGGEDTSALALQPDGRILVGGSTNQGGKRDATVVRLLNPQGTFDTTYGLSGGSRLDAGGTEFGSALALQPDGRIIVAGYSDANGKGDFFVSRLINPQGTFDPSFGAAGNGKALIDLGGDDTARAVALQPDGRIVVAGYTTAGNGDVAVIRLLPSGTLDPSFGAGGKAEIDFGVNDVGTAVALQPDGKIVVVGRSGNNIIAARLQPNGQLDTTFANRGKAVIDFGGVENGNGVALQPDGRIVVVGSSSINGGEIAVARLQGDPPAGPGARRGPGGGTGAGPGATGRPPTCAGTPATIVGTPGRDVLRGTPKADVIVGLAGNDVISGLGGSDLICGGLGNDLLRGGAGADRILGGAGADQEFGGAGPDLLAGGAGADRLLGGLGRDRLLGGAGADRLLGGGGRDILAGGPGRGNQVQ